eukprot:TRINITY_DN56690_c0_g1_i1.p1 TRINITY_DN56690_c0_g1~~TRINITY_DN56690_c0_g1_i1.p1  ORF type:complete len:707 (-),score=95.79 TRINITY_DN56690_c0_g1_i1:376-2217(-)
MPARLGSFAVIRRKRLDGPPPRQTSSDTDAKGSSSSSAASSSASLDHWRRWYRASHELGRGVSAAVFEAQAVMKGNGQQQKTLPSSFGWTESLLHPTVTCTRGVVQAVPAGCEPERCRQVAIKRFKKLRSRSFQTELSTLWRVGVHPNVVRLFEVYEDCDGEDVLILEYCDGGTVSDAYARMRRAGELVPELLVARIVRQVLLALEHINACGVEHQDVKPENMLLYNLSMQDQRAEMKLGDFGWATIVSANGVAESIPLDGAGSLWYAPPELNPPVEALGGREGEAFQQTLHRVMGRSDMWSVGVVVYLLLVGQNPFHAALQKGSPKDVELEVVRLVALGLHNVRNPKWLELPHDARDFISSLLRVVAAKRMSVSDTLRHPYLVKRLARCAEVAPIEPAWRWADRDDTWARLDGFQRLGWVAIARAVAEPELRREVIVSATRAVRASSMGRPCCAETAYLWQLAREISSVSLGAWLRERGTWPEVARLGFRYLDVDCDGCLTAQDLVSHHLPSKTGAAADADAWSAAHHWVARWGKDKAPAAGSSDRYHGTGLSLSAFRAALIASPRNGDNPDLDQMDVQSDSGHEDGVSNFSPRRICTSQEEFCGWGDARFG